MLFFSTILAGIVVAANAQFLRISPFILGSTTPGSEQLITLSAGPALNQHVSHVVQQPNNHHLAVVKPIVHHEFLAAPTQAHTVSKPIAQKLVHVAQPTIYKQPAIISQPVVKVQSVVTPVQHSEPIVSIESFAAPVQHSQPIVNVQAHAAPVQHSQPIVKVGSPLKIQEEQYEIQPYSFDFDSVDENGAKHKRQETKDVNGVVTGSYALQGIDGHARIVNYIADVDGFRAMIKSNEPGLISSAPANVQIESSSSVFARR